VLGCTFAFASLASEETLGVVLRSVPLLGGWGSSRPIAFVFGLAAFLLFVERARRRYAESSSFALTVGSGVAALCGVASVFSSFFSRALVIREVGLVTAAFTLGGIALLLPSIPAVPRVVTKVKASLYLGALFLALSAGAELERAASSRRASEPTAAWMGGEAILLFAAVFFVTLAVHLARPIEREALIAEARARQHSDRAEDGITAR
jgi:hypothetical protein